MAPSRSVFQPKFDDVIDLVSSDDDENASSSPSYGSVVVTGKRNRDDSSRNRITKEDASWAVSHPVHSSKEARTQQHSTCMPFLHTDVMPDNAIVTDAIIPLLHRLHLPGVITASGRNQSVTTYASLLHLEQIDKWSCGFRNLQMMLTALLPHLPSNHSFYHCVPDTLAPYPTQCNHRPIPIPSLHQLQIFLQDSWRHGFDERGAEHYRQLIVGKEAKIGAMEVSTVLSYLYVDCAVVQFINCRESRALLGSFVSNYFLRGPCFVCDWSVRNVSCLTWAEQLLDAALTTLSDSVTNGVTSCSCPVLPLYLQWEGHSVTIVGVETKTGDINFLIFDPMKSGRVLKQALSSNRKDVLAPMRLSSKKLLNKNCQVLLCSPRALSDAERNAIRECASVNVTTAAREAVRRTVES